MTEAQMIPVGYGGNAPRPFEAFERAEASSLEQVGSAAVPDVSNDTPPLQIDDNEVVICCGISIYRT